MKAPALPAAIERHDTPRIGSVLRRAAGRLDGRALLAGVSILAFSMTWNALRWARYMAAAGPERIPAEVWWSVLLIEALCTTLVVVAVLIADEAVDAGAPRVASYALAVLAAVGAAAALQPALRHALHLRVSIDMPNTPAHVVALHPWFVFLDLGLRATLLVVIYVNVRTTLRAERRRRAAEVARATAERRALESRLQAMQARVEPEFLFNTLQQVGNLHEVDPRKGTTMLDDLIEYLRAALPHLRRSTSALGQEADLAHAYVRILRVQDGERLQFAFDVPADVRDARMPPMVLVPLIDAVLAGGRMASGTRQLAVAARAAMGELVLDLDVLQVPPAPGTPEATLDALRERLDGLYGGRARFAFARLPRGLTRATLAIPLEPA